LTFNAGQTSNVCLMHGATGGNISFTGTTTRVLGPGGEVEAYKADGIAEPVFNSYDWPNSLPAGSVAIRVKWMQFDTSSPYKYWSYSTTGDSASRNFYVSGSSFGSDPSVHIGPQTSPNAIPLDFGRLFPTQSPVSPRTRSDLLPTQSPSLTTRTKVPPTQSSTPTKTRSALPTASPMDTRISQTNTGLPPSHTPSQISPADSSTPTTASSSDATTDLGGGGDNIGATTPAQDATSGNLGEILGGVFGGGGALAAVLGVLIANAKKLPCFKGDSGGSGGSTSVDANLKCECCTRPVVVLSTLKEGIVTA
jgi:hypothetical protein